MAAWLRLRVPLVAGETPTPPLECLVAAADSASGVAVAVDPARATFVNGDLTIALHRGPVGQWMCRDAASGMTYAYTYIFVTIGSDITVGRIVRDAHAI